MDFRTLRLSDVLDQTHRVGGDRLPAADGIHPVTTLDLDIDGLSFHTQLLCDPVRHIPKLGAETGRLRNDHAVQVDQTIPLLAEHFGNTLQEHYAGHILVLWI